MTRMSDAQRLSDAMMDAAELLASIIGLTGPGVQALPATIDFDRVPLAGLRSAKIAMDYMMVGVGVLDAAIAGDEPLDISLDEELTRLLGGGPA